MLGLIRKYPRAFAAAVAVHIAVITLLVVSFEWAPRAPLSEEMQVLQAVAVDERQVQAEMNKIRAREEHKQQAEQDRVRKVEEKVQQEQNRLSQLETQRKQEAERRKKAEIERVKAEQQQIEAQRLAEESGREAKKMMEKQRKLEEAEERRKKIAEDAKRAEKQHAQEMEKQNRQYIGLIQARVKSKWVMPLNWKKGARCEVAVRLIPGGDVVSVSITKSCGDALSDKSVENAVRLAAPLPVPSDPQAMAQFRNFTFTFTDEK